MGVFLTGFLYFYSNSQIAERSLVFLENNLFMFKQHHEKLSTTLISDLQEVCNSVCNAIILEFLLEFCWFKPKKFLYRIENCMYSKVLVFWKGFRKN